MGGLCTDVGFSVVAAYANRLKETYFKLQPTVAARATGVEFPFQGGLRFDIEQDRLIDLAKAVAQVHRGFSELAGLILETPSIQNRFEAAGILSRETARDLSVVGPIARASGIDLDVRRDHPYGSYAECAVEVPVTR